MDYNKIVSNIWLHRIWSYLDGTFGFLTVEQDGHIVFRCFTVELPWLDNRQNISCVSCGEYPIVFEWSDKFGQHLWELKNVLNRSETKLHVANRPADLLGCLGLGDSIAIEPRGGYVTNSANTLKAFHGSMRGLLVSTITISNSARPQRTGPHT
jgi:hypothetical protein